MGWTKKNNAWYYIDNNGRAYKGWHKMGEAEKEKTPHWSYFEKDGRLTTGWRFFTEADGEKTKHWSYFGDNGWLRTGWQQMGKGTNNPDGNAVKHWSFFGSNGWLRTGWQYLTAKDGEKTPHWSYFGKNGWLRTGLVWLDAADGETPHYSYFGDNGWLRVRETVQINGKKYIADSKGWLTLIKKTYTTFINTSKGKGIDYDGRYGVQCVDLIKAYLWDVFSIRAGAWGDAVDYYTNYKNLPELVKNFDRIANTPSFVPKRGDIIVWNKTRSNPYGHIAIATGDGNTRAFYSYDQNYEYAHQPCTRIFHDDNYANVLGVLRPKNQALVA